MKHMNQFASTLLLQLIQQGLATVSLSDRGFSVTLVSDTVVPKPKRKYKKRRNRRSKAQQTLPKGIPAKH